MSQAPNRDGAPGLKIQHLGAGGGKRAQQAALAATGNPAHDAQIQRGWQVQQGLHHVAAVAAIAAFKLCALPADAAEYLGHAAGALAATPAIDQGPPGFRLGLKLRIEVTCDIGCHQRGAGPFGSKRRGLFVQGADACALIVIEHRRGDRAWNMVKCKLGRRAHVDDAVKFVQAAYVDRREIAQARNRRKRDRLTARPSADFKLSGESASLRRGNYLRGALRSGASSAHTLSRMRGCASATG